jgi:hypothetical protein
MQEAAMVTKIKSGDIASAIDFPVLEVLGPIRNQAVNPSGARVVACNLDEACVQIDCEPISEEIAMVLENSREGHDYVMHYCGIDFLQKNPEPTKKK